MAYLNQGPTLDPSIPLEMEQKFINLNKNNNGNENIKTVGFPSVRTLTANVESYSGPETLGFRLLTQDTFANF